MSPRPPTGRFIGSDGYDPDVADGVNIVGPPGPGATGLSLASETEAEAGTDNTKAMSPLQNHNVREHLRAVLADVTGGDSTKLVFADLLGSIQTALEAQIAAKHDTVSLEAAANAAISDSALTDAQKREFRLRIGALAKEGEWTDPMPYERAQGPQPRPPYTTTVRARVMYATGISIADADDVRFLRSASVINGVAASMEDGYSWIEVLGDRIRALPAIVEGIPENFEAVTIQLRFVDADGDDDDRIYYVGRTADNILLIGTGDDSDAYIGMFVETRNEDVAGWAQGGNTDRIPKNKLPSDTAYTADLPAQVPEPTSANRGQALFVDTQAEYELRAITDADMPGETFTSAEKTKLDGLQPPVKPDWNALESAPAGILNKPDVPQVVSTLTPPEDALPDFRLRANAGIYAAFSKGATPSPTQFRFTLAGGVFDTGFFGGSVVGSSPDVPTEVGAWAVRPVRVAVRAATGGGVAVQLLIDEAAFSGPLPSTLDFRILDPSDGDNVLVDGSGSRASGGDRGLSRAFGYTDSSGTLPTNGQQYVLQVGGLGSGGNAYDAVNLHLLLSAYRWNLIVANLVSQVDARLDRRIQIVDSAAARPADHATLRTLFVW